MPENFLEIQKEYTARKIIEVIKRK